MGIANKSISIIYAIPKTIKNETCNQKNNSACHMQPHYV